MKRSSCAVVIVVMVFGVVFAGVAAAQQYPLVDMVANNVIQKYQDVELRAALGAEG